MATPNQDSTTSGIPVSLTFTQQGKNCLPPSVIEALESAQLRITIPTTNTVTTSGGVTISALQNNITRLDSVGAIYTPGITKVELQQQSVTLTTTTAPGVPVDLVLNAPGVPDLQNSLLNIFFTVEPPEAPVYIGPPVFSGGTIRYSIFRVETDDTPPYDEIVVRGDGRIFVIPSAATV